MSIRGMMILFRPFTLLAFCCVLNGHLVSCKNKSDHHIDEIKSIESAKSSSSRSQGDSFTEGKSESSDEGQNTSSLDIYEQPAIGFLAALAKDEAAALRSLATEKNEARLQLMIDILPEYLSRYSLDEALGKLDLFRDNVEWHQRIATRLLSVGKVDAQPSAIIDYFSRSENASLPKEVAESFAHNFHDQHSDKAFGFIENVRNVKLREQLIVGAIVALSHTSPEDASRKLSLLPDGANKDSAIYILSTSHDYENPKDVAGWINGIGDAQLRTHALTEFAGRWNNANSAEMESWLQTQSAEVQDRIHEYLATEASGTSGKE